MNFYSHAVIASWITPDSGFVLGSMLPDLCRMAGEKPLQASGALKRGIACHERVDEVFHAHAAFRRLCSLAFVQLSERGLSRGSAKAAAHIGVELLIDDNLFDDEFGREHYVACIAQSTDLLAGAAVSFGLSRVLAAMRSRGAERTHTSPQAIAQRIDYATRDRRRLALTRRDIASVCAWANSAHSAVAQATPGIVLHVAAALDAAPPEHSGLNWSNA